ncbi:MAG: beta-galactosidase [Planctomycetes bacterium]|nr:beta-galactosidase [Planctomycetota bacterium]
MARFMALGVCAALLLAGVAQAQDEATPGGKTLTFEGEKALADVAATGDVGVDAGKGRSDSSALRVGPGGKAVWQFAEKGASGTIEMWVFEDGTQRADPKTPGSGPLWGVMYADGAPALLAGAVYASYLGGNTTYAVADMIPGSNERPWQQVQYLGVKRDKGWHKWTFKLDPENGMSLLCDDKPIKAFVKDKIRLNAVSGIIFVGDDAKTGGQTVWIDDVTATPGAPMRSEPLWPPPPPEGLAVVAPPQEQTAAPYAQWKNGLSRDANYFPIAVWLQAPSRAPQYKAAGINLYVGLWQGPTEEQLAELKKHEMPVICDQNEVGLKHIDDPIIVGWMHGDEPDNAQKFKEYWNSDKEKIKEAWPELYASQRLDTRDYTGYGPPVPPKWIIRDYEEIRRRDPSRPVMVNLGCGVAWEGFVGRGERTGKLEDYPEYIKGCDVVSYDVYPVTTGQLSSQLWYQAQGVGRLCTWTEGRKPVWNCLECTGMANVNIKPTPHQVKAQAWMAIIHGSRGLIYFVHQFNPFNEAALLDDPEMLAGVTALNRQIQELAPVLNSATIADAVTVASSEPHTPVHAIVKRHDGATYVLAVSMYSRKTEAAFKATGLPAAAKAEVIGEDRTIDVTDGGFKDAFEGHEVHLYRIK